MPKDIVCVPWYRREDYEIVRSLLGDRGKVPETYEGWLARARRAERLAEENGRPLSRVYVRPKDFTTFCAKHRRWPTTESLLDYVRECGGGPR